LIDQNVFVEKVSPGGAIRKLTKEEMVHYRQPFLDPASREPVWRFPNEIPIAGEPADVWEKVQTYVAWLFNSDIPKLFFWVSPAVIITPDTAERFTEGLRNTKGVYLGPGLHYIQEDHPHTRLRDRPVAAWFIHTVVK